MPHGFAAQNTHPVTTRSLASLNFSNAFCNAPLLFQARMTMLLFWLTLATTRNNGITSKFFFVTLILFGWLKHYCLIYTWASYGLLIVKAILKENHNSQLLECTRIAKELVKRSWDLYKDLVKNKKVFTKTWSKIDQRVVQQNQALFLHPDDYRNNLSTAT